MTADKVVESNRVWLKERCNRYTNGQCQTRWCLVRGGYASGPPDYEAATCEPHEILQALYSSPSFTTGVEEAAKVVEGCVCHGCGRPYRVDLIVPDDLWRQIRPDQSRLITAGLLCGMCIMARIELRGEFGGYFLALSDQSPSHGDVK